MIHRQHKPPTELAYLHQTVDGFWQVGFIYLDYVLLVGDQLTFLGADKERDAGDKTITVRDYRFLLVNTTRMLLLRRCLRLFCSGARLLIHHERQFRVICLNQDGQDKNAK